MKGLLLLLKEEQNKDFENEVFMKILQGRRGEFMKE
jgi:hypothetical protein